MCGLDDPLRRARGPQTDPLEATLNEGRRVLQKLVLQKPLTAESTLFQSANFRQCFSGGVAYTAVDEVDATFIGADLLCRFSEAQFRPQWCVREHNSDRILADPRFRQLVSTGLPVCSWIFFLSRVCRAASCAKPFKSSFLLCGKAGRVQFGLDEMGFLSMIDQAGLPTRSVPGVFPGHRSVVGGERTPSGPSSRTTCFHQYEFGRKCPTM